MANGARLGDRIRARRVALGLTLAHVADAASLSIPYVSNLERGRGNPTIDALRAIARALNISVADLVGEDVTDGNLDVEELVLAEAPRSLTAFSRSPRFESVLKRSADHLGVPVDEMRSRLLIGMASAPRRSVGEPTEEDWRRLLDVYSLILSEE